MTNNIFKLHSIWHQEVVFENELGNRLFLCDPEFHEPIFPNREYNLDDLKQIYCKGDAILKVDGKDTYF